MQRLNLALDAALARLADPPTPAAAPTPPSAPSGPTAVVCAAPPGPVPRPGGRLAHDVASFTIEALPVEAFEALVVVAIWVGEVIDDDPPYRLDVWLGEPFDCWCRLDLVPDAGASTVALTLGTHRRPPRPRPRHRPRHLGRRAQHARPGRRRILTPVRLVPRRLRASESDGRRCRLLEAVADGVAEAVRWGEDGDDAVGAGCIGGAQLGVDARGRRRRGRRRGRSRRPGGPSSSKRAAWASAATRSGTSTTVAAGRVVRRQHPGGPGRSRRAGQARGRAAARCLRSGCRRGAAAAADRWCSRRSCTRRRSGSGRRRGPRRGAGSRNGPRSSTTWPRGRRADPTEAVGRRRRDGEPGRAQQRLA